jgi:hypothetical protein
VLRDIADALVVSADATHRWARRAPCGLGALVESALEKAGPVAGTPRAAAAIKTAEDHGEPEPVTVLGATFYDERLADLRFREGAHARALSLLIVVIVSEARRYGARPLVTRCHHEDGRLVLRFADAVSPSPPGPGRGTGEHTLRKLLGGIPGAWIDVRGVVDGRFIDLPKAVSRFGVQVSLPLDLLEGSVPAS